MKSSPNISKPNNAKIQNTFLKSLFGWKCNKVVHQGTAIFGYFINEPTKSSLIGEKLPNLVTLFASKLIYQNGWILALMIELDEVKIRQVSYTLLKTNE